MERAGGESSLLHSSSLEHTNIRDQSHVLGAIHSTVVKVTAIQARCTKRYSHTQQAWTCCCVEGVCAPWTTSSTGCRTLDHCSLLDRYRSGSGPSLLWNSVQTQGSWLHNTPGALLPPRLSSVFPLLCTTCPHFPQSLLHHPTSLPAVSVQMSLCSL